MPCNDGGYSSREYEQRRISETEKKLDKVTQMLCKVMTQLDNTKLGSPIIIDTETDAWWKEHQEKDRQRLIKERREKKYKIQQTKNQIKSIIHQVNLTPSEIEEVINQLKNNK